MAVLIHMGKLSTKAMLNRAPSPASRGRQAEDLVARLFHQAGWEVQSSPQIGPYEADLIVNKGRQIFVVEIKSLSEGRADRVIPILSQAILQAKAMARENGKALPLAVICVERASPSLLNQVGSFSKNFASDVAIGIIAENGLRHFSGGGLEVLNAEPKNFHRGASSHPAPAVNLFSDLHQWMLKILLAPEIPENLLAAPRHEYRSASELAVAAQASQMSAFRFVQQLKKEGFLDDSSRRFVLVRRVELFQRWKAASLRQSPELPMRFLIRGSAKLQLREIVSNHQACLGLFAAADAFNFGHVAGVPPYVYVPKLPRPDDDSWKELVRASPSESPDLILKQASIPKSVFRGMVHRDGIAISDIVQVWLDVAAHPSRGEEQADVIYRKVLRQVIESVA